MSGISGFFHAETDFMDHEDYYKSMLENMHQAIEHRGPDAHSIWVSNSFGMAYSQLILSNDKTQGRPIAQVRDGQTYGVIFDGELYNKRELQSWLSQQGCKFFTESEEELLLLGYLEEGPDFVKRINGVFAIAIADTKEKHLLLFRDRCGIKPLFYSRLDQEVFFASEQKGFFSCPGFYPTIDKRGLNEIFSLGPAKTYGSGVYKGIDEVLPGHYLVFWENRMEDECYWNLKSEPHTDSYEKTVEKTADLLTDAVIQQSEGDAGLCSFLSGGLDSSLVSAISDRHLKQQNKRLTTFSFDFTGNETSFKANDFQPSLDRPYVDKMVGFLGSDHHYLECSSLTQADLLYASVDARDLPAMADVDSSLLHFCSLVTDHSKIALTGECADEIFGGYPWFHKEECFHTPTFPWTMDLNARKILLRQDFVEFLGMDDYVSSTYERSVAETPILAEDSPEDKRRREISYLNLKWFMQTLIDRMDRTSMHSGLSARVPFADYRIIEYLWNVPWQMKASNGVVKGLLRDVGKEFLPDEILYRRKSPYPKSYDTGYEAILIERMKDILYDSTSPILNFIDVKKTEEFMSHPSDYGKPWYGQLMAGPQMLAYLIQVNYWLKKYQIDVI